MSDATTLVLTGLAPGPTGTGQLVEFLLGRCRGRCDVAFYHIPGVPALEPALMARVLDAPDVLILHPQTLGAEVTLAVIAGRAARGRTTRYFVLDCSFFCRRSYNHIPGEADACLRCMGGQEATGVARDCTPHPTWGDEATAFVGRLRGLGAHLHFLVQTEGHARLIRRQFGPAASVTVVGLWVADWESCFADPGPADGAFDGDVLFHGDVHPAKGFLWALLLAERCPHLHFVFPCGPEVLPARLPANIEARPMRWASGLAEAVRRAPLVLVPSLWSAPIEGALVKSLAWARRVGVVDIDTPFAAELPDDLVLRLAPELDLAASMLAADFGTRTDPAVRAAWLAARPDAGTFVDRLLPGKTPT